MLLKKKLIIIPLYNIGTNFFSVPKIEKMIIYM